ncbi:MAG: flagellar filament capping protein FliD [Alphaproteobacteria bacterium]
MSDTSGLNLNNINVDESGRVSFSGLRSGIDIEGTVDAIIQARRIPVDRLETRVADNQEKLTALDELESVVNVLRDRLSVLRGAVSFNNANNIFAAKNAFASASRIDSGSASPVAEIMGISVDNSAALGSSTIEVLQIAKAHKLGSGDFSSKTSDLQTATGAAGPVSGNFQINGVTIDVLATDSLADLRDRINNANSGDNATGVTASIVSASETQHVLVLTADETGTDITLSDDNTTGVLSDLGISSDGGSTFLNELQQSQLAQLHADGLRDPSQHESILVADDTAALSSYTSVTGAGNTFEIRDASGALIKTVTYDDTDTLQNLATAITGSGLTGQVVSDGGQFRLEIIKDDGGPITISGDTNNLLTDLSFSKKDLVIERASNTINDLFAGVTLTLFKAEVGTAVQLDVEQDLSQLKTAITDFVDAYNELRTLLNSHQIVNPETGEAIENTGVLFGNRAISEIESRIGAIIGGGATGTNADFTVLAQIGVNFVDNSTLSDPLLDDTLEVDNAALDQALLSNSEEVRKLFAFDFTSSDPRVSLLSFTGQTSFDVNGFTLNIEGTGSAREDSVTITDKAVTLDQADSFGATTSGQFEINGTAIAYDVTTDTLEDLAATISAAGITGISASINESSGSPKLVISSTQDAITVNNDTGDLLAALGLTTQDTLITGANINGDPSGASDGSVTINGMSVTATNATGADGLRLFYSGAGAASGVDLDYTIGLGSDLFFDLEQLLGSDGALRSEIDSIEGQNEVANERIANMLTRLEIQRATLTDQYIAMEAALSRLENLRESIRQLTDSLNNNNN